MPKNPIQHEFFGQNLIQNVCRQKHAIMSFISKVITWYIQAKTGKAFMNVPFGQHYTDSQLYLLPGVPFGKQITPLPFVCVTGFLMTSPMGK